MATWSTAITRTGTPGTGSSTPGPSTGIGGFPDQVTAHVPARNARLSNQVAQEMKQREAAGEENEAGSVMGLMRCAATCQREYMICEMEQGDREKAARKEKQKVELSESSEGLRLQLCRTSEPGGQDCRDSGADAVRQSVCDARDAEAGANVCPSVRVRSCAAPGHDEQNGLHGKIDTDQEVVRAFYRSRLNSVRPAGSICLR